jgi:hypothetical protein
MTSTERPLSFCAADGSKNGIGRGDGADGGEGRVGASTRRSGGDGSGDGIRGKGEQERGGVGWGGWGGGGVSMRW